MSNELVHYQKLRTQHRMFVDEYCTGAKLGKPYSATKAAEAAGYSSPKPYGHQLMQKEIIKKAIQEVLSKRLMSKEEVIKRIQDVAKSDIGDILEIDPITQQVRINALKLNKKKRFLKSFGYDSNGNPKYEFHDAYNALRDYAKIIGVIGDEGIGGNVNVTVNINFVRPGAAPDVLPAKVEEPIPEAEWEEDEG